MAGTAACQGVSRAAEVEDVEPRMPDRDGVKQALAEIGVDVDAKLVGDFFDLHKRRKAS